jgi:hypothetical protein
MKLSIIVGDNAVYLNEIFIADLELSAANIPATIHALQWNTSSGWIEFKNHSPENQNINVLPDWATVCVNIFNTKYAEIQAAETAARAVQPQNMV